MYIYNELNIDTKNKDEHKNYFVSVSIKLFSYVFMIFKLNNQI